MKLSFFSTKIVYIKLSYNYIEIVRLDNGEKIEDKPIKDFSDSKIIFADYENAEVSIKFLLKSLFNEYNFLPTLKAITQVLYNENYKLSSVEKRAILDSLRHCNAKAVFLIEHNHPLTISQAKEYLNRK